MCIQLINSGNQVRMERLSQTFKYYGIVVSIKRIRVKRNVQMQNFIIKKKIMKNKLLSALSVSLLLSGVTHAQTMMYGITNANTIFTMSDVNSPSTISGPYNITGMASGQAVVGIDSRSSDGGLYALGYDSVMHMAELYRLSSSGTTYTATAVSGTLASMDLGNTNNVAFDFVGNSDDQIRVMGRNGNHYMMGADGTLMSTGSGTLSYATGDVFSSSSSVMAATAYTNSFYGSDATQQVGYDANNNVLVKFDAGDYSNGFNNSATNMHSIGAGIGAVIATTGSIGMDSWYDSSTHNNMLYMTGSTLLGGAHLYKYNMAGITGAMTDAGAIGDGSMSVRDIAFANTSRDSAAAMTGHMMTALSLNMRNLIYFDAARPENIRRVVRLNGMTAGQSMIGIDYSGSNHMLYGLGYNSGSHTYQLYTIDSATGHATAVNTTPGSMDLGTDNGSGNRINAGFRFISTATNRIRVMGNNGAANMQLDATNGTIAATNSPIQYATGDANFGGTANLTSMAYTGYNNDATTQMFGFDANTGMMVKFSATNDNAGYGDGTSGYLNTGIDLSTTLNLALHNTSYNNAHMNIMYDQSTNTNVGYIVSNYSGDSSAQQNFSTMYDMTTMLTAYHKGTAGGPVSAGKIGYGVPVKDITASRYYTTPPTTAVANVSGGAGVQMYPNPAISVTRILLPVASEGKVTVNVIDMGGNVVRTYKYEPRSYQLDVDVSNLPSGLYSVRVSGKGIASYNLKLTKGM